MPALLPVELQGYAQSENEDVLFDALLRKPADLVDFFDYACDDEGWSRKFTDFMRKVLTWVTVQSFQDRLTNELLLKITQSIRSRFDNLRSFIPLNLIFRLKDTSIQVNSALYSAATPFFHDLIKRECFDKKNFKLEFHDVSYAEVFRYVEEYVCTGYVSTLWRMELDMLMPVLRYSTNIQLKGLSVLCEQIFAKYVNQQNVYSMLLMAQKESLSVLKQAAFDFINGETPDIHLEARGPNSIACQFYVFSEKALDVFAKIRQSITDLVFSGQVSSDPAFATVVRQCPSLVAIDLSHTTYYTEYLPAIPSGLQELNISACEWLSSHYLKKIVDICPGLQALGLASNVQLTAHAWGELMRLRRLKSLDLARCQQVRDDDLKIVLHACSGVADLNLEECKLISEKAFYDLARACIKLQNLNLSRTNVTDAALVEIASRCRSLSSLNLTRCDRLTDKGVMEAVKNGFNLLQINITNCNVSKPTILEITKQKPMLTLIK